MNINIFSIHPEFTRIMLRQIYYSRFMARKNLSYKEEKMLRLRFVNSSSKKFYPYGKLNEKYIEKRINTLLYYTKISNHRFFVLMHSCSASG
jgi:hypothetical protein